MLSSASVDDGIVTHRPVAPAKPGTFSIYAIPALTMGLLLCVAREAADGNGVGDNAEGTPPPAFGPIGTEPGSKMTAEQISLLKEKSGDALAIAAKLSALYCWAQPMVACARALIAWGLGGSTSSAIDGLEAVVVSAEEHKVFFFVGLSRLYRA